MKNKVEILSPAGSFECLVAALKSGADAIYVGGDKFGARANAHNFTTEELKTAIDLTHLHGKQLYLTVNTLLKEDEINEELYEYLAPLYEHGIDAVIVQDLGVLQFVKCHFPELPIHASTQMTVTSLLGAQFLERQGVERIVTSRELSVEEVQDISKHTKVEIESFVHGALCYSYSGQCLYSSMLGGRSGNRGQCAQPCRLPYSVNGKKEYYMSLKDICTLQDIPDLIEAGVYSFKIEGRMKKPEYVASVTAMYRKYVDLYLEHGRKGYKVSENDIDILRDIFNRGDFHGGYWKQRNGQSMITTGKPSHTGIPVLEIINQNGRTVTGKALKKLHKGDILDISESGDNYTLGKDYNIHDKIELSLRKGVTLSKGTVLYRTRNQWLIRKIQQDTEDNRFQIKINGTLVLIKDNPATLHLQINDVYVTKEVGIVQKAENKPITREKIENQIKKTGTTHFQFDELDIVMEDDIFVSVQELKQLRRDAIEYLETTIVSQYRRTLDLCDKKFCGIKEAGRVISGLGTTAYKAEMDMVVYVETKEQLLLAIDSDLFTAIYIDCGVYEKCWENSELKIAVQQIHTSGKKAYFVMPHIFRIDTAKIYMAYNFFLQENLFDGVMVRNLESFEFLKQLKFTGEILLDHHVYIANNWSGDFWANNGATRKTHSLELTVNEINKLEQQNMELVIYGYTPNMISAQCIKKTTRGCNHHSEIIKIKDRINKEIPVKSYCDYCYNVVYHYCPTVLFDELDECMRIQPSVFRVNFTLETKEETKKILEIIEYIKKKNVVLSLDIETTKGHFRQGIR